jgi:hypothetical protein
MKAVVLRRRFSMPEIEPWKTIVSLIDSALSKVPVGWRGPLIVLFVLLLSGLILYHSILNGSNSSAGNKIIQFSCGDYSPNASDVDGNITQNISTQKGLEKVAEEDLK